MKIGVIVGLYDDMQKKFEETMALGFSYCQISSWDHSRMTEENADMIKKACEKTGMTVSSFWCGLPGPAAWNFIEGPLTLGFVPVEYRYARVEAMKHGVEFAAQAGIKQIVTHAGFIPEDPNDEKYTGMIAAMRPIIRHCKKYGVRFLFETGQETPVTLKRTIEDLGGEMLGINLDTGNLILYGKANPADALDVFGEYVYDLHAKDGFYPTDGRALGKEAALGEGRADFPRIMAKLKKLDYKGPITIEREISGEQQTKDILKAKAILESLMK